VSGELSGKVHWRILAEECRIVVEFWQIVLYEKNQQETRGFLTVSRFVRRVKDLDTQLGVLQTPQ
jgi:hypothetical protein